MEITIDMSLEKAIVMIVVFIIGVIWLIEISNENKT